MNKYLNIVSFWVDELVNDKEKYNITSEENGKNITIFVDVEEDCIGKVIGKNSIKRRMARCNIMNKYLNIVSFWVDELVNDKEKYNITSEENGKNITIFVDVEEDCIGKVIGKNGNIITSIRNLINSISKIDKKNIKIIVKGI